MGRTQRALTSLVAAIPAGVLTYLLVMVFLNQADSLKTTMQIVVGLTLLAAIVVAAMPLILFIPGKKKSAAAGSKVAGTTSDEAVDVMDDDGEALDEATETSGELSSASDFDLADSDSDVMSDSSGEIDTGPTSSTDDIEAFEMDDDEDEKPKPKKRKK